MKSFELLPHTADVRIFARGSSLKELFSASLEALCSVIRPDYIELTLNYANYQAIQVQSQDQTSLLIDFLSSSLTLMHKNRSIYPEIREFKIGDTDLVCTIAGNKIDYFTNDVKAVTYHEAEIICNNIMFETLIVLDI